MASKTRDVLAAKHRHISLPMTQTIALWLLMDRIGIAGWGWGVFWTLIGIWWFIMLIALFMYRPVARTPVWEATDE
jgi:hypothetical protein